MLSLWLPPILNGEHYVPSQLSQIPRISRRASHKTSTCVHVLATYDDGVAWTLNGVNGTMDVEKDRLEGCIGLELPQWREGVQVQAILATG